jgi:dihydroxyacetone kinase
MDMAGCSLSVTWLDSELEALWTAPADTPAFRRGRSATESRFTERRAVLDDVAVEASEHASEASIAAAAVARRAVRALADTMEQQKDHLGQLDSVAGDGDHGSGMARGSRAAAEAAESTEGGVQSVLAAAGAAFGDKAGGTSGILWGVLLDAVGRQLGNTEPVTGARLVEAVRQSADHLKSFSKAELGDKTMLDALFPFVEELVAKTETGVRIDQAWREAAAVCQSAAEATASLVPRIGRARPLAERSIGTPDPGAISLSLIVTAVGEVLTDNADQGRGQE